MMNPNNSLSVNEYAKEPSPSSSISSSPAATSSCSTDNDSRPSSSNQRAHTLKARIKRNMLNDHTIDLSGSATDSAPPAIKGGREPKEGSVFEAASALASLGLTSPMTSFNRGQVGGAALSNAILSSLGGYVHAPVTSATINPTASFMGQQQQQQQHYPLLSLIQTPVSQTARQIQVSHQVNAARPFASLIGSDIPLTFPQKLMEVLSNPEVADIITWLPHGKGFLILHKRRFALEVMPLYYKHSLFTSFTRKLNRWGFTRVARGPEMGAYFHKNFQRGNYLLCMKMHCQSPCKSSLTKDGKATKDRSSSSPTKSPATKPKEMSQKVKTSSTGKASPTAVSAMSSLQQNVPGSGQIDSPKPNMQPNIIPGTSRHGPNQQIFQLVQSTGDVNQYTRDTAQRSSLQPTSNLQSCLKRSHHLQSMGKLTQSLNLNQAAGVNANSLRNHQDPVIANSLNALKSSHKQALLTTLIAMDQAKARNLLPQVQGVVGNARPSQTSTPLTSFQVQSILNASLGSQRQHANEYNQCIAAAGSQDSSHAVMLAKMKQLSESNHNRTIELAAAGLNTSGDAKSNIINLMTPSDVTQLCNQIRQQQQHASSNVEQNCTERKFHRAVRRPPAA